MSQLQSLSGFGSASVTASASAASLPFASSFPPNEADTSTSAARTLPFRKGVTVTVPFSASVSTL